MGTFQRHFNKKILIKNYGALSSPCHKVFEGVWQCVREPKPPAKSEPVRQQREDGQLEADAWPSPVWHVEERGV